MSGIFFNKKHRKQLKEYKAADLLKKKMKSLGGSIDEVKYFEPSEDPLLGSDYGALLALGYWSIFSLRSRVFENDDFNQKIKSIIKAKIDEVNGEFIIKHSLECDLRSISEEYLNKVDIENGHTGSKRLMESLIREQKEALMGLSVLIFVKIGFYESDSEDLFNIQVMSGISFVKEKKSMSIRRGECLLHEEVVERSVDQIENLELSEIELALAEVLTSSPL